MPAARLNLTAERGAKFTTTITWRDNTAAHDLVNLTGYTAKMDVRTGPADSDTLLVALTTANGRITLGGAAGTITLTIPEAVVTGLTAQTGWYDLFLINGSAEPDKIFAGVFVVEERTTG